MRSHARLAAPLCLIALSTAAHAQGGHLGEGAPPGSFIGLLLGLVAGLGAIIALGLVIVRPAIATPPRLTGPVIGGLALALPIVALAVAAMLWLEALWPGIVIALGLGGGYVAAVRWRWRRSG